MFKTLLCCGGGVVVTNRNAQKFLFAEPLLKV